MLARLAVLHRRWAQGAELQSPSYLRLLQVARGDVEPVDVQTLPCCCQGVHWLARAGTRNIPAVVR